MKKTSVKIFAAMLALVLCFAALCGCATKGKTLMELDGERMSVNMFQLYLSRMKGIIAYERGEAALTKSFWDTVKSSDGTTYNDYYTAQTLDNAKTYLAALSLFEEEGLKLPDDYVEEIESEMQRLLDDEADGSKNTLNSMLAQYGVNYKILKEAYTVEAKISYLNDYLFGENGSKIDPTIIEDYYQSTYVRFKQVFIYTYDLVYEEDEFGNDIWYSVTDNKRIAYDVKATPKYNDDGSVAKDKNNDIIYVNDLGEIAYDRTNAQRAPKLAQDGSQLTREYTMEELIEKNDTAQLILEMCEEGNYTLFDSMAKSKYNEDEGMFEYDNGYYMTRESDYDAPNVIEALFEMKTGEVRKVTSDYGIHVIMKYELDEGGYADADNKMFFRNADGKYLFIDDVKGQLLAEMIKPYKERIVVNEELLDGVDIKSATPNYYY